MNLLSTEILSGGLQGVVVEGLFIEITLPFLGEVGERGWEEVFGGCVGDLEVLGGERGGEEWLLGFWSFLEDL